MYENRGVIFDNVGVFFENPLGDIKWIAEKYGLDPEKLNKTKDGIWVSEFSIKTDMPYQDFWQKVFNETGYDIRPEEIGEVNQEMLDRHKPIEAMLRFAKYIKEKGIKTCLWTNNSSVWFRDMMERYGLAEIFPFMYVSGNAEERKDAPEAIETVLSHFDYLGCEELAAVDDQQKNLDALGKAGVDKLILHTDPRETVSELNNFLGIKYDLKS